MSVCRWRRRVIALTAMVFCLFCRGGTVHAQAVPVLKANFHTISVYWTRGANGQGVKIRYRPAGASSWLAAQDLWRDDVSLLSQFKGQYRGSLVNLEPNTAYEIAYSLDGGSNWATPLQIRTRSNVIPGTTVTYSGTITSKIVVTAGGTAANWKILDGQNLTTVDPDHRDDCIQIKASYVVVRNFKLQDCRFNGVVIEKPNVIVENNTITDWGIQEIATTNPKPKLGSVNRKRLTDPNSTCIAGTDKADIGRVDDTGILARLSGNDGIVIQRNVIRNPRYRSTRWAECPGWNPHPWGPRGINIVAGGGNFGIGNVVRFNEIYSENTTGGAVQLKNDANRYYDVVGVQFGQDLDVYGNIVRNGTDDLIEADGAAVNVRIWGNYLDYALNMVSLQLMQAGPVYIFRNVLDRGADIKEGNPGTNNVGIAGSSYGSGSPFKLKQNNGGSAKAFLGPVFIYHNTTQRTGLDGYSTGLGISGNSGDKEPYNFYNVYSVNNVFMTASIYISDKHPKDFVGYRFADMHNRPSNLNSTYTITDDLYATAVWKAGHGPTATWAPAPSRPTGLYQVVNAGTGVALPNFNDAASRGRGAHQYQANDAPMTFGTGANWTYRPSE